MFILKRRYTIMYCEKCGKTLPEGSKFCPECGSPVTNAKPDDPFTVENEDDSFKATSEKFTKSIFENEKKHIDPEAMSKESIFSFSGMIRKFAIYSVIAFFLPTLTISCYGTDVKMSSYDAMVGKVGGESIGSTNISVLLLLAVPLLILCLHLLKKPKKIMGKTVNLATLILVAAELVLWFIYIGKVSSYGASSGYESVVKVKLTLWMWLNILGMLLSGLMSWLTVMGELLGYK